MNPSLLLNAERKRSKRIVLVQGRNSTRKRLLQNQKFRKVEKGENHNDSIL